MWIFGLTAALEWWKWLLMVLGAGFCWRLGEWVAGYIATYVNARRK
jgi:hypothetical protein